MFQQCFCRYLISDNIPESITCKDEEFKGLVHHLLLAVEAKKKTFRGLHGSYMNDIGDDTIY
jgi:hypothetical protein